MPRLLVASFVVASAAACGARSDIDAPLPADGTGGAATVGATASVATSSSTGGQGGAGGAGGTAGGYTVDISSSADSLLESESHVAVFGDQALAAAWIGVDQNGFPFVGYALSHDGGTSWTPPQAVDAPGGVATADPVVAARLDGSFHLTYLGFDPFGMVDDSTLFVATAGPGATSFGPAVAVAQPAAFYDKPWMTVTPSNTVLVSYAGISQTTLELRVARSTDGAQSFSTMAIESDGTGELGWNLSYPCVAAHAGSRVYLTYIEFTFDGAEVILRWSDDDGASWPIQNRTVVSIEPDVAYQDPACVAFGDELWVSYGLSSDRFTGNDRHQKLHTIRLARSIDGGASILERADAPHDSDPAYFLLPALARASEGDLYLGYFAGEFEDDPGGSFRFSRAQAGTLSFEPSAVARTPILFRQLRGDPQWLGDYVGLSVQSRLHAVFPDNTSGLSHVLYHRAELP